MHKDVNNLKEILEYEAEALRNGNFEALAQIVTRKETAWARAQQELSGPGTLDDLAVVQRVARRNAHLLVAAQKGLIAAAKKISNATKPRDPLTTYGSDGTRSRLGPKPQTTDSLL